MVSADGSPVSHLHLSGFIGEIGMAEVKGEGMQRETEKDMQHSLLLVF